MPPGASYPRAGLPIRGGKVTKLLKKTREQTTQDLMARFKHLVGAQAIRSYLAAVPDSFLDIQVRIVEEELLARLKPLSPSRVITYAPGMAPIISSDESKTQL